MELKASQFFLLIALCSFAIKAEGKLPIGIYIEALCRASREFITDQFESAYDDIKDDVEVSFYTHGKSKSFTNERGEIEFECQHGPSECEKNKFQTCGLHQIGPDQDKQADFIICTMGYKKSYWQCVSSLGLNQQDIDECVGGQLGTELQLKMESASAEPIADSGNVPTITFNGKYNGSDFYAALDNFRKVVLRILSEN